MKRCGWCYWLRDKGVSVFSCKTVICDCDDEIGVMMLIWRKKMVSPWWSRWWDDLDDHMISVTLQDGDIGWGESVVYLGRSWCYTPFLVFDDQCHHHWWCWCWWWLPGNGRESRFVSTKGFCPTKSRLKVGSVLFLPFTFLFSLFICTLLLLTQRKEDVLVHDAASSRYFTWKIKWPGKQYCDIDQNCVLTNNWEAILFP